jgi:hypothetical protein
MVVYLHHDSPEHDDLQYEDHDVEGFGQAQEQPYPLSPLSRQSKGFSYKNHNMKNRES